MFSALGQKPEVRPQTENPISDLKSSGQTNPKLTPNHYLQLIWTNFKKSGIFSKYRLSYSDFNLGTVIGFSDPNLINPESIRALRSQIIVKMLCCQLAAEAGVSS